MKLQILAGIGANQHRTQWPGFQKQPLPFE